MERDSWTRPKRAEESGGKGMQEVAGRLDRAVLFLAAFGGVGKYGEILGAEGLRLVSGRAWDFGLVDGVDGGVERPEQEER